MTCKDLALVGEKGSGKSAIVGASVHISRCPIDALAAQSRSMLSRPCLGTGAVSAAETSGMAENTLDAGPAVSSATGI